MDKYKLCLERIKILSNFREALAINLTMPDEQGELYLEIMKVYSNLEQAFMDAVKAEAKFLISLEQ